MNRKIKAALTATLCFGLLGTAAFAHGLSTTPNVRLLINGAQTQADVYIKNDVLYAPLREICEDFGAKVEWDTQTHTAQVYTDNGSRSNFSEKHGSELIGNRMYTPIRSIAAALGKSVYWDHESRTAFAGDAIPNVNGTWGNSEISTPEIPSGSIPGSAAASYDEDDVYWLACIIYAEARGESMEGKIAVGNVILNRVASDEFPDTIYDVIFDTNWGVQFEPVSNGTIYCTPDEDCYEAARRALDGEDIVGSSLYFFNPSLASSFWISNNCEYVTTIG